MTDDAIVLNETIHQSTRLRIMTMLVGQPDTDRLAYGFIQQTLDLTGGNLTTHLRKLGDAACQSPISPPAGRSCIDGSAV